jgi:hypothetical protein
MGISHTNLALQLPQILIYLFYGSAIKPKRKNKNRQR